MSGQISIYYASFKQLEENQVCIFRYVAMVQKPAVAGCADGEAVCLSKATLIEPTRRSAVPETIVQRLILTLEHGRPFSSYSHQKSRNFRCRGDRRYSAELTATCRAAVPRLTANQYSWVKV